MDSMTGIRGRNTFFFNMLKKTNLNEDQELIDINRLYLTIFHEALFMKETLMSMTHINIPGKCWLACVSADKRGLFETLFVQVEVK